jgi:hypothetical protein
METRWTWGLKTGGGRLESPLCTKVKNEWSDGAEAEGNGVQGG